MTKKQIEVVARVIAQGIGLNPDQPLFKEGDFVYPVWKSFRPVAERAIKEIERWHEPDGAAPEVMMTRIDELCLSVRTETCLKRDGIEHLGDLVSYTPSELMRIPNLGKRSLDEVIAVVGAMGLSLGMSVPDWPITDALRRFREKI